ncbi:MAG: hypothetical protein HN374_05530 [Cryomorphaceae bacterium]|jgi:hypothetical protein|nr:hypothetical protein [Cryomorphaceae bacterium]
MGVEVALFKLDLEENIKVDTLVNALFQLSFSKVKSADNSHKLEHISNAGIIEVEVIEENKFIKHFFVRFSLGNPNEIIDALTIIITKLNDLHNFNLFYNDLENFKKIDITKNSLFKLKEELIERKNFFDNHHMRINIPIRGGKETFDYIRKNKKCQEKKN